MPTNYNEGTPRDPNVAKQLNKLYKSSSAPESNSDVSARKKLEGSFKAEPSTRPEPTIQQKRFTENSSSARQSKSFSFYEKAEEFTKAQYTNYQRVVNRVKANVLGTRSQELNAKTSSKASTIEPPGTKPKPAVPGAGAASGIASLGIGYLVDRYVTPYLMDAARRAGGSLSAELNYKLGKISEAELAEALRFIRDGNGSKWGEIIKQIRKIQEAAKKGKKRITQTQDNLSSKGLSDGVLYIVSVAAGSEGVIAAVDTKRCWGPIGGSRMRLTEGGGYFAEILCRGIYQGGTETADSSTTYAWYSIGVVSTNKIPFLNITDTSRADGLVEVQNTVLNRSPIIITVVYPSSNYHQSGYTQTPKTTDKPPEINKAKPTIIIIPAGFPIGVSNSDGTKATEITPPTTSPSKIEIPHPRTQEPTKSDEEKKVPPLTISNPNSPNIKLETSGSGPVTINIPGYNPITVAPGTNKPQGALPVQDVQRQYAPTITPGTTPTTSTKPSTTPTTTPTPTTPKPATKDDLDQFKKDIEKLITTGTVLAGLTPAIQSIGEKVTKIGENTTPESITTAAAAGTCRTTQPGGCTTKAIDDAVSRVNQNTNNATKGLDALAQAEQLRLLNQIDGKIGGQLPGGISGFMQTAFRATRLDKILNALTFITTLHNAAMLSRNLGQTLGDLTSQALSIIGIKDEKDSPIDINAEIGKQVNNLISSILGAETWTGTKLAWNKANTIISSATAITYSVRSLFDSTRQIAEWTAENTGKIGNALKKFRVVGENAYPFMREQVNSTNAWALKVDRVRQGVDSLDDAASSLSSVLGDVQNIQQEYAQIKEQKDKFDENIKSLTPKSREENKPVADTVKAGRDASKSPADASSVFRGEGEAPNAGT